MKRTCRLTALILCLMLCCPQGALAVPARAETDSPVSVGGIVTLGHYEQDNDLANGAEPIEWLVLDVQGDRALLLSRYGLDQQPYNSDLVRITWEGCTLRAWLNSEFLNNAFSAQEQSAILLTDVDNSAEQGSGEWSTEGGNSTQDQIFLLSCAEVSGYLGVKPYGSNEEARVTPTAYAIEQGAYADKRYMTADGVPAGSWTLRSPGFKQSWCARVFNDGSLSDCSADFDLATVRPALWLDLSAFEGLRSAPAEEPAPAAPAPKAVQPGDTLTFGHYEQDNDPDNGAEPIEWLVLDVQGDRALLLSRYGLDAQPYNTEDSDTTWETCSLRAWLNGVFAAEAFSAQERDAILLTKVDNSAAQGVSWWEASGGNSTQDLLFLLSCAEAERYMGPLEYNNTVSRAAPTAYAVNQGASESGRYFTENGEMAWWWWLRSPGMTRKTAAKISFDGSLHYIFVYSGINCVRPALWLDLTAAAGS